MNKEQVYDEQVFPLMARIIDVCKEHGIAMIASFDIPTEDHPGLRCTSLLPDESGKNPDAHKQAYRILRPEARPVFHLRTTHEDGSETLTAIL